MAKSDTANSLDSGDMRWALASKVPMLEGGGYGFPRYILTENGRFLSEKGIPVATLPRL